MIEEPAQAEQVLDALLGTLPQISSPGEEIVVHDAWVDTPRSVCVVYEHSLFGDGVMGLRKVITVHARSHDPQSTGEDIARSLTEPLGSSRLHRGPFGVTWWGVVDEDGLPVPPRWRP